MDCTAQMSIAGLTAAEGRRFLYSGPANNATSRHAIQSVIAWLADAGLAGEARGDVEIALAEAVNNVVKHGYCGVMAGRMRLDCRLTGQALQIDLTDNGPGLPGGAPPKQRNIDLSVARDQLPEGGFGWLLIRRIADEVDYARCGESNVLTLRFDVSRDNAEQ